MSDLTRARRRIFGWLGFSAALLAIIGVFQLPLQTCSAGLEGPRAQERHVALVVSSLLNQEHLLQRPLDDEISRRALSMFLKNLDPMKVYFYQSDIDEFMQDQDRLDDLVKSGELSFAYKVFNRFLERVEERVEFVDVLLKQEHDFAVDEELVTDPDAVEYAKSKGEAFDRWRKRVKYDLLVLKSDDVEGQEAIDRLSRRYRSYGKRMQQFSSDDLLEMFLSSITLGFDPHTTYMSPSSLENFQISMRLKLEGIGAALMMDDGYTVVSNVIPGGAADKDGRLKPEDRIVSVGEGEDSEMVDVIDMNLNDVVKLIRGRAGTTVRLGVKAADSNETQVYKITRAAIELKDSEARSEIIPLDSKPDETPYQIGVIDLPSFYMDMTAAKKGQMGYKSTTQDVKKILDDFNAKGVDVVILDLTRNGGGSLSEAINLTGLFIDRGPVVQVKDADNRVQSLNDEDPGMAWKGPLIVLTSKFSASASEILAGAIQDYGRGIIVGDETTHGKGTVQSLLDLGPQLFRIPNPPNLGALKITMQQFYRPSGESTQKRGVVADVVMPSLTNYMDISESDLDYPIEFDRVDAANYSRNSLVTTNLLAELKTRSESRRSHSDDFAKLLRRIDTYRKQKERKSVTLNEQKFFQERAELDAEKEDEKQLEEQIASERPVFRRYFYNDEILQIALDYVRLLTAPQIAEVSPGGRSRGEATP